MIYSTALIRLNDHCFISNCVGLSKKVVQLVNMTQWLKHSGLILFKTFKRSDDSVKKRLKHFWHFKCVRIFSKKFVFITALCVLVAMGRVRQMYNNLWRWKKGERETLCERTTWWWGMRWGDRHYWNSHLCNHGKVSWCILYLYLKLCSGKWIMETNEIKEMSKTKFRIVFNYNLTTIITQYFCCLI